MVQISALQRSPAQAAVARVSWRILPLIGVGYLVAYMDRVNISFAAARMNADLGFGATVYGFGAGLFFLAYALFEVPSNVALERFGARRWLARIMITWGILAAAMMLVRTPWQFYGLRFLLGMAEAGFFPGVICYLALWFPRSVRGTAISRFYLTPSLAGIVMGVVSPWLLSLGWFGLKGWQWLFVIQGLPAVAIGLVVLAYLPDTPDRVAWLTDAEKGWIAGELAAEHATLEPAAGHGVIAALRHPLVWRLGLFGFFTIGAYITFALSAPQLLAEATGLGAAQVGLLTSLASVLAIFGMLLGGVVSDRRGERFTTMLASTGTVLIGYIAMAALMQGHAAAFIAAYLVFNFAWPMVTLSNVMSWPDLLPRRHFAVGSAAINTLSQLGAFVLPSAWGVARDGTGTFRAGLIGLALASAIAAGLALATRAHTRGRQFR